MTADSFGRMLAKQVVVDPPIGGATNVQAALGTSGGVTFQPTTNVASADAATAVPSDGAAHVIPFVIAAPPAWLDATGRIIEVGLYRCDITITSTAAPTTPGQSLSVAAPISLIWVDGADGLDDAGPVVHGVIVAIDVADLPFPVAFTVTTPTDVTATYNAQASVARLVT